MTNNGVHVCSGDQTALSRGTNPITYSPRFKFCPLDICHCMLSPRLLCAGQYFLPLPILTNTHQKASQERHLLISSETAHRCCTASILPLANLPLPLCRPCRDKKDAVFAGCNSRPDSGVSSTALDQVTHTYTYTHMHTHKHNSFSQIPFASILKYSDQQTWVQYKMSEQIRRR